MSLILDALKKSDAERHLGELPDMHTQTLSTYDSPTRQSQRYRRIAWIALGVASIAIAALGWQRLAPQENSGPVIASTSTTPSAVPISPRESAGKIQTSDAASAMPQVAETPIAPPANPPKTIVADALPVPPPAPKPVKEKTVEPVQKPAAAPTPEATAVEAPPAMSINELPPDLRRELPPLAVSGSMYSANPENRMVILDKRLVHEGDQIAPGLILETLAPRAATLSYRGYRFRVTF